MAVRKGSEKRRDGEENHYQNIPYEFSIKKKDKKNPASLDKAQLGQCVP